MTKIRHRRAKQQAVVHIQPTESETTSQPAQTKVIAKNAKKAKKARKTKKKTKKKK